MRDDGGSTRADRTELPEEVRVDLPVPLPVSPVLPGVTYRGVTMDNVNRAQAPSGLVPGGGEKGDDTEWDASSLESAIGWLESHASFLHNQSYEMVAIQDKMGGVAGGAGGAGGGGKNPLGAFDRAGDLGRKHSALFTSTQQRIRSLSESLYQAANALKDVKENYETAEKANEMSALEMTRAFTEAPTGPTS